MTRLTRRADPPRGRLTGDGKGPWPQLPSCFPVCAFPGLTRAGEAHVAVQPGHGGSGTQPWASATAAVNPTATTKQQKLCSQGMNNA